MNILKERSADDEVVVIVEELIAEGIWEQDNGESDPPKTPDNVSIADKVTFSQIYPDPFNPIANIPFRLLILSLGKYRGF